MNQEPHLAYCIESPEKSEVVIDTKDHADRSWTYTDGTVRFLYIPLSKVVEAIKTNQNENN